MEAAVQGPGQGHSVSSWPALIHCAHSETRAHLSVAHCGGDAVGTDYGVAGPVVGGVFSELDWWIHLLPEWNGVSVIAEFQWVLNADLDLFTDASGTGFGACWQGAWLTGRFVDWACDEGMAFKELFAITMALVTWGSQWQGKKIRFLSDNKAVFHILHFKNSWKPHLAALLCTL